MEYFRTSPTTTTTKTTNNNNKQEDRTKIVECKIVNILKIEREILKNKLEVHMDQQYSFWHYPRYHIPIDIIKSGIQLTNDEIRQIDYIIYIL